MKNSTHEFHEQKQKYNKFFKEKITMQPVSWSFYTVSQGLMPTTIQI